MLHTSFAPFGRTDPFVDMHRMQREMNRVFEDFGTSRRTTIYPPVNFWAGPDSIVMSAELPGLTQDDIELTVKDTMISIHGAYPSQDAGDDAVWSRRERPRGTFSRSVELPFHIDPENIDARFENGVLTVEMQRPEDDKPKRIKVKAS